MKKLIFVILLLISTLGLAQYPIIEEFDSVTTWIYTGGAGMQNYGGSENYATFNIGNTPYPNNSTITITSPVYNLTNCASGLVISFPLKGNIENGWDKMYFEYFNAGAWVTFAPITGIINPVTTYSSPALPNTTTQFRFRLVSDNSINGLCRDSDPCNSAAGWYGCNLPSGTACSNVYYYDITRFTITCAVLPIELLEFTGKPDGDYNLLKWITASETNNNYFTIERSLDAWNFFQVGTVNGAGTSSIRNDYSLEDTQPYDGITYYRLTQTDYNGQSKTFQIISVSRMSTGKDLKVIRITNLLGQEVTEEVEGIKIYYFNDGSVIKKCKLK